ncbi:MAG: beta-glucosidase, partial [Phototrophicales bacterium]
MSFPQDFWWGVATSSYQIEGAVREDGRGESIWDRFSHTHGKVWNGDNGDIACDHYHRYPEDIRLMQFLGINAYRFSVAWPRILPYGKGQINSKGLDFYDRLVDCLLEADIRPCLTLYHWDLPQALQDLGGWANRDIIGWFCDYADIVSRRLGDRVGWYATFNELEVIAYRGHLQGLHAPGIQDAKIAYQVAHHLLLSHSQAVPILRENAPHASIGIV